MFALLWILNTGQTDGIDTVYKNYYKSNISKISCSSLSLYLDKSLKEKIISIDNWTESSKYVLSYEVAQQYFKLAFLILSSKECDGVLNIESFNNVICLKEKNSTANLNLIPLVNEKISKDKYFNVGNIGIIPIKFNAVDPDKIESYINKDELFAHYQHNYTPSNAADIIQYFSYRKCLTMLESYRRHGETTPHEFIEKRGENFLKNISDMLITKGDFVNLKV